MPRAPNARSCALPRVPRPQLEEARALCDEAISPLMTLSGPAGAWRLPRGSTRSASAELPTRFRERSGTFLRDRDRRGWTASGPRGSSRRGGGRTEPASSDCDSRQQSPEGGGRGMRRLVPGRGAMQEVGRKPVCSGWEGWRADAVLSDRTTVAVREVDPWGLPLLRDRAVQLPISSMRWVALSGGSALRGLAWAPCPSLGRPERPNGTGPRLKRHGHKEQSFLSL